MQLLAIAAGGALGAVLRFYVDGRIRPLQAAAVFPWGIFTVNVLGSFALGALYVLFVERNEVSEPLRLGLTVGLLGAFTTFSTFSLDAVRLIEQGRLGMAAFYVLSSVLICLLAAWLGMSLLRQL